VSKATWPNHKKDTAKSKIGGRAKEIAKTPCSSASPFSMWRALSNETPAIHAFVEFCL
jgi:hypothetical protein